MNAKSTSGEVSEGNEEHAVRNWRKDDPCQKVGKNLVKSCSMFCVK